MADLDPQKYNLTPLMIAAAEGDLPSVDAVLAAGAKVNARDNRGATALMYAVQNGHRHVTRALLQAGADPRLATHSELTALEIARKSGFTDLLELLQAVEAKDLPPGDPSPESRAHESTQAERQHKKAKQSVWVLGGILYALVMLLIFSADARSYVTTKPLFFGLALLWLLWSLASDLLVITKLRTSEKQHPPSLGAPSQSGDGNAVNVDASRDGLATITKPRSLPTPSWAWLFVVGCGIIPVLTLGGAIPGAIGIGGASACFALARRQSISTIARVAGCFAITAGCWVAVIALLGAFSIVA